MLSFDWSIHAANKNLFNLAVFNAVSVIAAQSFASYAQVHRRHCLHEHA